MPAYNFQPRFVPLIEAGTKLSTIRRRPKTGRLPEPGETVNLYVYQRTKRCRLVKTVTVSLVRPIVVSIDEDDRGNPTIEEIALDGTKLLRGGIEALARADGFENAFQMAEFFAHQYGGEDITGYLIEWHPTPTRAQER